MKTLSIETGEKDQEVYSKAGEKKDTWADIASDEHPANTSDDCEDGENSSEVKGGEERCNFCNTDNIENGENSGLLIDAKMKLTMQATLLRKTKSRVKVA